MLEIEDRGLFENSYGLGFAEGKCIGFSEVQLEFCQKYLRAKKQYENDVRLHGKDKISEKTEIRYEAFKFLMEEEPEANKDLIDFLHKYETLPLKYVLDRVWRESEYWHGPRK